MAIAFDAASSGSATGTDSGSSVVTVAHTVTGSNTILIVNANNRNAFTPTRPAITYNGVAMTFAWERLEAGLINYISTFYLVNPTTGANNIVVTFPYPGSTSRLAVCGMSFTGVHQVTPIGTAASAEDMSGNTTTATVDITSASGELVVDNVWAIDSGAATNPPLAVGAGQTDLVHIIGYASQKLSVGGSSEAGAATVTMSWSLGVAAPLWMIGGMPLKPAATASGNRKGSSIASIGSLGPI